MDKEIVQKAAKGYTDTSFKEWIVNTEAPRGFKPPKFSMEGQLVRNSRKAATEILVRLQRFRS